AFPEALHAAGRVNELLLPGEEGVAAAADLDAELLLRGAGRPGHTAGAVDQNLVKLGMDVRFHGTAHSTDPGPGAQAPGFPAMRAAAGRGGRIPKSKESRVLPLRHRSRHGRAQRLPGPARDDDRACL